MIAPYQDNELEELHHIGIIYDVELECEAFNLKMDAMAKIR
ncbi:hypothetical protein [Paenibacillus marinisediminis]